MEKFGFREVREVSSDEVIRFMQHLATPAEEPRAQSVDAPLGPELTMEQYDALINEMTRNAAAYGTRKPHG